MHLLFLAPFILCLDLQQRWAEDTENADAVFKCSFAEELAAELSSAPDHHSSMLQRARLELAEKRRAIESCCETVNSTSDGIRSRKDLLISNTHQVKGAEFPVVVMADDFKKTFDMHGSITPPSTRINDELNLVRCLLLRVRQTPCWPIMIDGCCDFVRFTLP